MPLLPPIAAACLASLTSPSRVLGSAEAPAPAPAEAPDEGRAGPQRVETVALSVTGVDVEGLRRALALRLPDRRFVSPAAGGRGPGFAFWEVRYRPETQILATRLIFPDGRSYRRESVASPERAARLAAALLANLLPAIEQEQVAPDEVGVALPESEEVPPAAAGSDGDAATTRAQAEPKPAAAPAAQSEPRSDSRASAAPAPWEIGLPVTGGVSAGLGPPTDLQGLAGGTVELSVWARERAGGAALAAVRGGWRRSGPFVMERLRLSLGGGYVWRGRWLELPVLAAVDVEWWRVTRGGEALAVEGPAGDPAGRKPLLGGWLTVAPGVSWWPRARRVGLRLGVALEIAASGVPRAGIIRVVEARGGQDRERLRAGGLELAVGVSLGLWIPVRAGSDSIKRARRGAGGSGSGSPGTAPRP